MDARIDAKPSTATHPNDTATTDVSIPADSTGGSSERSQLVALEANAPVDELATVVSAVTTIAQSWCEHAMDYADIETLVCRLPIDQYSFAAHDALASYSGPSPMALLVRAFITEEINGWDDTALHDYLHADPSLRRGLGFETLPAQSTFWRAWHHRFSEELRDAVRECAALLNHYRAGRFTDRTTFSMDIDPQSDWVTAEW